MRRQTRLQYLKDFSCAYRYVDNNMFCNCELPNCPSYLANYQITYEVGNDKQPDRYRIRLHDGGIIVCNAQGNMIGYSLVNGDYAIVADQFDTLQYLEDHDVLTKLGHRLRNLNTVAQRKLLNKLEKRNNKAVDKQLP